MHVMYSPQGFALKLLTGANPTLSNSLPRPRRHAMISSPRLSSFPHQYFVVEPARARILPLRFRRKPITVPGRVAGHLV